MLKKQSVTKKILIKTSVFISLIVMVDFAIGGLIQTVFQTQESGKYARISEALNKTDADILIFGSSRAITNYNPKIIEDNVGVTCYNAGVTGQSILFAYAMQQIILERYLPKMIVINVEPVMLHERSLFYDRLKDLTPFYSKNKRELSTFFDLKSPFLKYALHSKLFAYNSTLLHILKFKLNPESDYKGFIPHHRTIDINLIDTTKIDTSSVPYMNIPVDKNYQKALDGFLSNCIKNDIKVIGIISPSLFGNHTYNSNSYIAIDSIFEQKEIPLIDYSESISFYKNYQLWADEDHLNYEGATSFSELIGNDLNYYFNKH